MDIIRDAIIRLRLEMAKGGFDSSEAVKVFEQQVAAAKKVEQQIEKNKQSFKQFGGVVPEDWGKLFKGRADAQNFAYQQYGDRGAQYLKDDPAHIAALKRMELLEKEGEKTEEFGRKSEASYVQAGRGVLQLTRGLAML